MSHAVRVGRRAFLMGGTLILTAGNETLAETAASASNVTFGLMTDLHYADKPPAGNRHYQESLDKLAEASAQIRRKKPMFVAQLGDLVDAADAVETEKAYLSRIAKAFEEVSADRHHVLGNHCVDTLTKDEFLAGVGQAKSYYSFDRGGVHIVVLDACFRSDGKPYGRKNSQWTDANVPAAELEWLRDDLQGTKMPVIVLAHQRLDVSSNHGVRNAAAVRAVLEKSGNVRAVFQGHSHNNDYRDLAGIHYCTLVAMVEGSGVESTGYAMVGVQALGTVTVTGFHRQKSYSWAKAKS